MLVYNKTHTKRFFLKKKTLVRLVRCNIPRSQMKSVCSFRTYFRYCLEIYIHVFEFIIKIKTIDDQDSLSTFVSSIYSCNLW